MDAVDNHLPEAVFDFPVPPDAFREVRCSDAGIQFALWAPTADAVRLMFYVEATGGQPCRVEPMKRCAQGMWRLMLQPDLYEKYYVFQVYCQGKWLKPFPGLFAKAVGVNGRRAALLRAEDTCPEGWENDRAPYLAHVGDSVIYELHLRDFSASRDSGMHWNGLYLSLAEPRTRTSQGERSGLSHLQELGVTHVHLMPVADFASADERKKRNPDYNWGYDPLNYNVPEGSYASGVGHPSTRLLDFRRMVMALHRAGLRVVMDVVYNHTYTVDDSNFQCQIPGYFYRRTADGKAWADGSGCGNETATEREGMRRFLVESVCYWAREFHIDGFRFDVMGLHDIGTMRCVRDALTAIDPQILLYGEGWSAAPAALPAAQCALKANMKALPGIAAFGDELRDGVRGDWRKKTVGGFVCGRTGCEESIKFGIVGGVFHPDIDYSKVNHADRPWAVSPLQMINYVSCHDGTCLTDRLLAVASKVSAGNRMRMYMMAETILLTSQGIPFLFAGDEMFRSRHGQGNPYNAGDEVNAIVWKNKHTYRKLFDYIAGLIDLRRRYACFRLRTAEEVRQRIRFLPVDDDCVLAYRLAKTPNYPIGGLLVVAFNGRPYESRVFLPSRDYRVLCRDGEVSPRGLGYICNDKLTLPPYGAAILESLDNYQ